MHRRRRNLRHPGVLTLVLSACCCLLTAVLLISCFSPSYSDCAFRCSLTPPACPDEYDCQSDGYCHLHGSTTSCVFTSTAADMSPAKDAALPTD